ncbi:GrpB family protein [Streptomyces albospinus]|uniref:GrpB family protein n=1 Tax=Streptomyces albospinus TaxID=285515 RepID=UPI00227D956B|nr:GrpB family protein [Streptomyces albospinus]
MAAIGFRCRPEPWNGTGTPSGRRCAKLVFAPPAGARTCNVRLREHGGPNSRYALLFRDCLRADAAARDASGAFKRRLAVTRTEPRSAAGSGAPPSPGSRSTRRGSPSPGWSSGGGTVR